MWSRWWCSRHFAGLFPIQWRTTAAAETDNGRESRKKTMYTNQQVDFSKFIALRSIESIRMSPSRFVELQKKVKKRTTIVFPFHSSSCSAVKHVWYVYLKMCVYARHTHTETRAHARSRVEDDTRIHVLFDASPFIQFSYSISTINK